MQDHYSTVASEEQRQGISRMINLVGETQETQLVLRLLGAVLGPHCLNWRECLAHRDGRRRIQTCELNRGQVSADRGTEPRLALGA